MFLDREFLKDSDSSQDEADDKMIETVTPGARFFPVELDSDSAEAQFSSTGGFTLPQASASPGKPSTSSAAMRAKMLEINS